MQKINRWIESEYVSEYVDLGKIVTGKASLLAVETRSVRTARNYPYRGVEHSASRAGVGVAVTALAPFVGRSQHAVAHGREGSRTNLTRPRALKHAALIAGHELAAFAPHRVEHGIGPARLLVQIAALALLQ